MSKPNLFLDSSALFAGIVSGIGAARVLLLLAESENIRVTISEQVIVETERAIAKKVPQALKDFRQAILASKVRIVRDPSIEDVMAHLDLISHPADVPIILAAMNDNADYLVTLNRKHFIDDQSVSQKSGLRIGAPGDGLRWVRGQLSAEHGIEKVVDSKGFRQSRLLVLGLSTEWIDLLMQAGVGSVDELSRWTATELLERLKTVNEEKKMVRKIPSLAQVEEWVKQANQTPGLINY
jgi:predicted nucleic acid-binding protein